MSCRVANVGKQKLLYITQHRLDLESSFFLDSNGKSEPVNVFWNNENLLLTFLNTIEANF